MRYLINSRDLGIQITEFLIFFLTSEEVSRMFFIKNKSFEIFLDLLIFQEMY